MSLKSTLSKEGFIVVPTILSTDEVKRAREQLIAIFSRGSEYKGDICGHEKLGNIFIDAFTRYRELRWLLFNPKLISTLKSILGDDFLFVPETAIHDSGFGGWHKDTTSQEKQGLMFQWEPGFQMVQVGIYLQENGQYGGGLDVVPGSHRRRDRFANKVMPSISEKLRSKLYKLKITSNPIIEVTIPNKAGDMIVFDMRIDHKASSPKSWPIPEEKRKLAIFMVASANTPHARKYVEYISSRSDYHYLVDHVYPEDLLEEARRNTVKLMTVK